MIRTLLALTSLTLVFNACQLGESKGHGSQIAQKESDARSKAEALCQRLAEIKVMPFKREKVTDEVYNGLAELNEFAIPCLIDELTNTTPMADPRHEPTRSDFFTVGDAAFFALIRIVKVPFDRILPEEVMSKWEDEGLYAYFEYVKKDENRRSLQANWRAWYDGTYKR